MRDDEERLRDIVEAVRRIEHYSSRGEAAFRADELIQSWMVRFLQVIGEAVYRLSDDVKTRHAEVPWRKIVGMRHVLVHDYFDIDLDVVWSVVAHDLPALKAQAEAILAEADGSARR